MGEISLPVLSNFVLFLSFPLLAGLVAARFKAPPIVGYIVGGLLLGSLFGSHISEEFLSNIAGLGVILLLFAVGLEVNLENLKRFGKFAFWGGVIQIGLSALFIFVLSTLFGFSGIESLFIGFSFALSSTAVVAKILQEKGEENSLYGALAMGILIFQDLAAIPLIIVADSLTSTTGGLGLFSIITNLLLGLLKAGGVLLLIYIVGGKFVSPIFKRMARTSREILNLFTIFFIFVTVYLFSLIGLPPSVAAFVAGVLTSQTLEHYHIFSQIRPLRDLFAILFFVFLGASIKAGTILYMIPAIIVFGLLVILIKFIVVLLIFLFLFRFHSRTSFSLALSVSQVGEFAFIILTAGLSGKFISHDTYVFVLAAVLVSIVLTPLLISRKDRMYLFIKKFVKKYIPPLHYFVAHSLDRQPPHIEVLPIKNHIIICGYGRVGKYIGRALSLAQIPFIAIDYNFYTVEQTKKQGIDIIYGDPTNIDILDYAQCEAALCLISAVPEKFAQEAIILNAKRLNPKIIIFSRIQREADVRRLKDLGAQIVVHPEFEAAVSIIRRVLASFDIGHDEILAKIKRLKLEHGME